MDKVARRGAVVTLLTFIGAIALPATGVITATVGYWLLGFALCLAMTEIVYSVWGTQVHGFLVRSPIGARSPIYRRALSPKVIRPAAPLGALDFEHNVNRASKHLQKVMGDLTKDTEASARVMVKYGPRFEGLTDASTEKKVSVSRAYAKEQARHISSMERHELEFAAIVPVLTENSIQRLRAFPPGTDLRELREITATLGATLREGRLSLVQNRTATAKLRGHNLQQAMNEVGDRHLQVVDSLLRDYDILIAYGREALAEIDGRSTNRPARRSPRRTKRGR